MLSDAMPPEPPMVGVPTAASAQPSLVIWESLSYPIAYKRAGTPAGLQVPLRWLCASPAPSLGTPVTFLVRHTYYFWFGLPENFLMCSNPVATT
jgi:hypothetical protein